MNWPNTMATVSRDISIVRGKRRLADGTVPLLQDTWIRVLPAHWPVLWGDAIIQVPAGWADLTIAMSTYLSTEHPTARIIEARPTSWNGDLNLLIVEALEIEADATLVAYRAKSTATCMICGEPGRAHGPADDIRITCRLHE